MPRPIPHSTPNSSISARSPFYRAQKAAHGKATAKGIQRARDERKKSDENSITEAVTRKK